MHAHTEAHAAADSRVPAPGRRARGTIAARAGVVAAGSVGRPPGQHAAGGAALAARARRGGRAVDLGRSRRSSSCGGLGTTRTSSPSATSRCSRSGRLPDNEKGRRRAEETAALVNAHLDGRTADGPRGRRRARHRQRDQVRRDDGHRRDPLGRRPSSDRLDRRRRRHRPGRRLPRARTALPPHLRADDRARVRALGGHLAARGCRRVRRARGLARRGPIAARRRVAAGRRRAGDARRRGRATPPRACCRAAMPTSCSTGAERELLVPAAEQRGQLWTSRVWPGALLVDGEIRGTWRRANEIVRIERLDEALTRRARGGRGRGAQPPAPRPRAGDRGRLGDVTDTNICSIVRHGRRVPRGAVPHRAEPRQGDAVRLVAEPVHRLRPPLHVLLRPRLRAAGRSSR